MVLLVKDPFLCNEGQSNYRNLQSLVNLHKNFFTKMFFQIKIFNNYFKEFMMITMIAQSLFVIFYKLFAIINVWHEFWRSLLFFCLLKLVCELLHDNNKENQRTV